MNKYVITLSFLCLTLLSPFCVKAQIDVEEHKVDSTSKFCKLLNTLLKECRTDFSKVIDYDKKSDAGPESFEAKKAFVFDASHTTSIQKKNTTYIYRAVFLSKDNRDELLASYHNLVNQVKVCLPYNYDFKEKKNPVYKFYQTDIKPSVEARDAAPDFRIYVQEDWINHHFTLIMEIKTPGK